jgi:1,4-alpha-glucan branching enzyme
VDYHWAGYEWVDFRDVDGSTISFIRRPKGRTPFLLFVCNFTPVPRQNFRVGVPDPGVYREMFNTDSEAYGGSNMGNRGCAVSEPISQNNHYHSLSITLPPLSVVIFESPL